MSYAIRIFLSVEDAPAGDQVAGALRGDGFEAEVSAVAAGAGWQKLDVVAAGQPPVTAARFLREGDENPVVEEIDSFLDILLEEEETPELALVEDGLRRARQMILLEVPEAFPWGAERTVVDALVEALTEEGDALIQADGEGFYDRAGQLLVGLE